MSAKTIVLALLIAAVTVGSGCSSSEQPAQKSGTTPSNQKQILQQRSGDYVITLLNETGSLKQGTNNLTLEFRRGDQLTDPGDVEVTPMMDMKGAGPMLANTKATPGERCRFLVIAAALVAMESMIGALVDVDFAVGPFLFDDLHVREWDVRIQSAEMHQGRNLRFLICHLRNETAVIADRRRQSVEIAGCRKCHCASKAETHDRNRTGRFQLTDSSRCIS